MSGAKQTELLEQEQEEKEEKKVTLKLITGGKEPPSTTGENWLMDLEQGTMFLITPKAKFNEFNLGLFKLVNKTQKSCTLIGPSTQGELIYVHPNRFTNAYDLWEIIGIHKTEDILMEEEFLESAEEDLEGRQKITPLKDT